MTEKKETKPEAKKAAPKAAAPKAAEKKAAAPKAKHDGATLKVVQYASPIGRTQDQRATLVGLRLNKLRREAVLPDTPAVRGMIYKVKHLVKVVG